MSPTEAVDKMTGAQYMAQVARLGCYLCRISGHEDTPAIVHHPRKNGGKRSLTDKQTIPLCPFTHHDGGPLSVHMLRKRVEEVYGMSEEHMSAQTRLDVIALVARNVRYQR